ncbi:MAG TPA: IS5 family transposase [Candidatus Saccharimonadales bacterium]|nr:IS5 family transposase [Candidatus Saccharimonadales bacterium]
MGAVIELTDAEWARIEGMFDPRGRHGAPAIYSRRTMVDAMLFLARTGCQWRYLPDRYPPWQAVWQQWRRWRTSGMWERAIKRVREEVRSKNARYPTPSMVMIDAQTVRGGRSGPTFHDQGGRGGRTMGAKRTILVEDLGLPVAARVDPASPHDVKVGRELLRERIDELPRLAAVMGDRGYRGLARLAASRGIALDIKVPPKQGTVPPPPPQPGKRSDEVSSSPSCRSCASSTPSHSSDGGGGCRAATRGPREVPSPG